MESKLDSRLEAVIKEGKLPGVAAIVLDSSGEVLYRNAFGVNDVSAENPQPYTPSTPTMIFSCTKLVTSIAALQLIEQGKLALTDLVEKYVPEIKHVQVIDSDTKDAKGNIGTRPMKTKPTVLHLITHTAGFTYDFFDADTLIWQTQHERAPSAYLQVATIDYHSTPLCADPGEKYAYGVNTDWLGYVVEAAAQKPLHEYIQTNIFTPLAMKNSLTKFRANEEHMVVHFKSPEGTLTAAPDFKPGDNPEHHGGGAYLISTLDDYSTLLLTVLNGGTHPTNKTQILSSNTVSDYLFKDFIPDATSSSTHPNRSSNLGLIPSTIPQLTNTGSMLPDTKLGWSCGLLLNLEDVPNGRRKGSGAWAGLGNLYYWIDPNGKRTGLVMTNVLPFFDPVVLELFGEVEGAAYGNGAVKEFSS